METPRKWYDRTGLVLLWLILFMPIGLYALVRSRTLSAASKLVLGLFCLLIVVSVAGEQAATSMTTQQAAAPAPAISGVSPAPKRSAPPPAPKKPDLEVLDHKWEYGEYSQLYITGRIKNNRSRAYNYAQVQFILYNEAGEQVGTAWTNTNSLQPGGTWRFKAHVLEKGRITYRLSNVSGW